MLKCLERTNGNGVILSHPMRMGEECAETWTPGTLREEAADAVYIAVFEAARFELLYD
jgi:hypothetical protein